MKDTHLINAEKTMSVLINHEAPSVALHSHMAWGLARKGLNWKEVSKLLGVEQAVLFMYTTGKRRCDNDLMNAVRAYCDPMKDSNDDFS